MLPFWHHQNKDTQQKIKNQISIQRDNYVELPNYLFSGQVLFGMNELGGEGKGDWMVVVPLLVTYLYHYGVSVALCV